MPGQPKSNYLFLRIIAVVSQSANPLTVSDIATLLKTEADVVAHCIGLHKYLQRNRAAELPIPLPSDYWAPAASDVISREMLEPKSAGRMLALEKALRHALGTTLPETVH
jgi:hypothetical protein